MRKHYSYLIIIAFTWVLSSCEYTLEPQPVDLLTDELVLNEPKDVANVEVGLYNAFRNIMPSTVIAGDFTADNLTHNGTFSQYRELGNKNITSANASAAALWQSIYSTVYISNFILEKLPTITGVSTTERNRVTGAAHFLRGYAYFIALHSFGGVPEVLTTAIETNRNIPRASVSDINQLIIDDYTAALGKLPDVAPNAGYSSNYAVRAALAKFYLYSKNWAQAETYSTQVISSNKYTLEPSFKNLVLKDFTNESIFEVGYTITDDPGTDNNLGLNSLFQGRREIIPSNQVVVALASAESGDRYSSITFNSANLAGTDNGWSVAKYGTPDQDNNNIVVIRLGEMYLIRAEARANQGKITGTGSAAEDINVLRTRANAPTITSATQNQMITLVEQERRYELAFEGHRWYDIVRTDRAAQIMPAFNSNWKDTYNVWPIPQREIQNNPALADNQNPGY
jgi:hypothetical protein